MNKHSTVKRYACFMVLGVILNLGLYQIAHVFHLPMWIDNIGTAYVSLILEPAAGLLVAFATNFYQSAFIYDSSSLVYYALSAACALCIGLGMRKAGRICWKRIFVTLLTYIVIASTLSTILTLWRTAGLPDSGWERTFYNVALAHNIPIPLACFFGIATLKVFDSLVMLVVLPLLYSITPKKFINQQLPVVVSWKNPYFHKEHKETDLE